MKFLVDNQLPVALARFLSSRGVDCQHVLDLEMADASDPEIWAYASRGDCVVISKDEDFVDHWILSAAPVQLVWIRKANCSNRALLAWLDPLWADTVKRLEQGEKFVELRA